MADQNNNEDFDPNDILGSGPNKNRQAVIATLIVLAAIAFVAYNFA